MKNVHIILTDKPSRLHLGNSGLVLCDLNYSSNTINSQHIYITSDEEIKPNKYCLINGVLCKTELLEGRIVSRQLIGGATMDICASEYSEIILTDNKDLIKDGVQAIDDEFLEWFVKNPSCEEVEVVKYDGYLHFKYIIIPKEEPKQHLIDMMKRDEELGLYEEPKQETISLEEAAEKYNDDFQIKGGSKAPHIKNVHIMNHFIEGANWQQEQILQFLYSEITERRPYSSSRMCEEVIKFIEQFKKK